MIGLGVGKLTREVKVETGEVWLTVPRHVVMKMLFRSIWYRDVSKEVP